MIWNIIVSYYIKQCSIVSYGQIVLYFMIILNRKLQYWLHWIHVIQYWITLYGMVTHNTILQYHMIQYNVLWYNIGYDMIYTLLYYLKNILYYACVVYYSCEKLLLCQRLMPYCILSVKTIFGTAPCFNASITFWRCSCIFYYGSPFRT